MLSQAQWRALEATGMDMTDCVLQLPIPTTDVSGRRRPPTRGELVYLASVCMLAGAVMALVYVLFGPG